MNSCTARFLSRRPSWRFGLVPVAVLTFAFSAAAEATNSVTAPLSSPLLPDAGGSLMRVFGALALVIGLFLCGAWFFRNWRQVVAKSGRPQGLQILESRSLGGRHGLFVVGYGKERFLIASSPGGVSLLSELPEAAEAESTPAGPDTKRPSFAEALARVLKGK